MIRKLILAMSIPVVLWQSTPCKPEPPALNRFQVRELWRENNRLYFGGKVPDIALEDIRYQYLGQNLGVVTCWPKPTLKIDTRIQFSERLVSSVLLHEMAHVASQDCVHGPQFQNELKRLIRIGAFDEILGG